MKNKKIIIFLVITCAVFTDTAFTILHTSGEIFETGSPFDGGTCSQCHGGGATTPTVTISGFPAFGIGNTYMPGQTYTVSINCSGSYPKYGFNAEVLNSNSSSTVADAGICGPAVTGNCKKLGSPTNYTHSVPDGTSNAATFSFQWIAPNSGSVFIYAAGLGVNFTGSTSGDKVSLASLILVQSPAGIAPNKNEQINFRAFPNPASDRINLSYFLAERREVSVKLFSLSGELIADLIRETQDAGVQARELRLPEGIAKGMYFLKLRINGEEKAVKLLTN